MNKRIILTAAFFGAMAVVLGAFGAHSLKKILAADSLAIWQKGVEYQFYHTFALLYLSTFARYKHKLIGLSFVFFSVGIILFSGSLYYLSLKIAYNLPFTTILGLVTPIGGLCLIFGWISLFLAALRDK
ncbi:DUF423 domain-containing protein [Pedobacter insulae]|uniref:Uncharacterized membrane protein YgdD, TMEM256/DUF423 family n=1 Tax=Pedobacter insulae TaxID=414048 RepID=A0A1I2UJE5_9SPHI|nr:DUF423 domain-containing protein [Pedobacter insulae]SFG77168.1 Uncharacterized membrane protein YgdD, TMEM256/DUF423 family [Pedobacter insulae]